MSVQQKHCDNLLRAVIQLRHAGCTFAFKFLLMRHILAFKCLCLIACCAGLLSANGQQAPPFLVGSTPWAERTLNELGLDERIGQLFMVAAYSNKDAKHEKELTDLVQKQHIGGVIYFQGGPLRQAIMNNRLQAAAKVPLMVGIDGEWGLAMRLDSTVRYPYQMALGAIQNDSLIYAMGAEIARQSRRLGIHVNFAPVADINNNPKNPVINFRSFGEDKDNVARKSIAYMRGMQDHGVLANAKHFPGHGDTDTDSHLALPVIKHSRARVDSLELYPFRQMVAKGLGSVMVAHLHIPALDDTPNLASTLSPKIVDGMLRKDLGFQGLIFTDALNMKGVSKFFPPGEVDLKALMAGNDVLLFPEDVPRAAAMIKKAITDGIITEAQLNASVLRILRAKEWLGLHVPQRVELKNLHEDLNHPQALQLKRKLSEEAVTLLKNNKDMVPLQHLGDRKIAVVSIGGNGATFNNRLAKFCQFETISTSSAPTLAEGKKVRDFVAGKNTVVVYVQGTNNSPGRNFGLSNEAITLIEFLAANYRTALVHMGNPYALAKLRDPDRIDAILIGYQDDAYLSRAAAEVLAGAIPARGKLPVAIGDFFAAKSGLTTASLGKLYPGSPLDIGLPMGAFAGVDSVAIEGMRKRAYPGCQVLVAKDGIIVYEKAFGFHTYEDGTPVSNSDLYDLASITKIAASTISLMKLQDEGKFSLDHTLGHYMPEIPEGNPYRDINLRKMMAHEAGLETWIPFYKETLKNGQPRWEVYSPVPTEMHPLTVARDMYISQAVSDSMLIRILNTPLRKDTKYKYSDIGYYFVKEIVKRQSGLRIDQYVMENFYKPMGLSTMGYLPLERVSRDRCIPTEYERNFRQQVIQGHVHDPGAAMQGGIGGHAGLFSNAYDLAVVMQMLLNKGEYGGKRYLSAEVVAEYTRCQFCKTEKDENRRGAGFDKPVMAEGPGPTCRCVSFDSFGHQGFTGTVAWADPVENVVYVFLSNRIYPTAENKNLASLNIRTRIQEQVYKTLRAQSIKATTAKGSL